MATFVVLAGFTDQGIRNVKETIGRAEAFKAMAKKSGVTVKDLYWTLGQYDVIAVCEAPEDEAATALSLSVCSRGNVRSQTLRAFSFDEMRWSSARWSETLLQCTEIELLGHANLPISLREMREDVRAYRDHLRA